MTTPKHVRWLLAVVCVAVAAVLFCWALIRKITTYGGLQLLPERPYNELTAKAVEIMVDQSNALFQLSLVILTALWALIIAKKNEANIALGDRPELLMFVASSVLLLLSIAWHWLLLADVREAFAVAGKTCWGLNESCIPDIFDGRVSHQFIFQLAFCVGGIAAGVLTLVSAHKLKEQL